MKGCQQKCLAIQASVERCAMKPSFWQEWPTSINQGIKVVLQSLQFLPAVVGAVLLRYAYCFHVAWARMLPKPYGALLTYGSIPLFYASHVMRRRELGWTNISTHVNVMSISRSRRESCATLMFWNRPCAGAEIKGTKGTNHHQGNKVFLSSSRCAPQIQSRLE